MRQPGRFGGILLAAAYLLVACDSGEAGEFDTDNDPDADADADGDPDDGSDADADAERDPNDIDDDGDGFSDNLGDCADNDLLRFPGAVEICDNEIDDDCDGVVDDVGGSTETFGPSEYLQESDSPWFIDVSLSTFVMDDFEDQVLPDGVSASAFIWSSSFGSLYIDSVDGDTAIRPMVCAHPARQCGPVGRSPSPSTKPCSARCRLMSGSSSRTRAQRTWR